MFCPFFLNTYILLFCFMSYYIGQDSRRLLKNNSDWRYSVYPRIFVFWDPHFSWKTPSSPLVRSSGKTIARHITQPVWYRAELKVHIQPNIRYYFPGQDDRSKDGQDTYTGPNNYLLVFLLVFFFCLELEEKWEGSSFLTCMLGKIGIKVADVGGWKNFVFPHLVLDGWSNNQIDMRHINKTKSNLILCKGESHIHE